MKWPMASVIIAFIISFGGNLAYVSYLKYLLTAAHILPVVGLTSPFN